jgi:hypothetical protein
MSSLRLVLIPIAVSGALALSADAARAQGPGCPPGGCGYGGYGGCGPKGCQGPCHPLGYPGSYALFGGGCQPLPLYQAAPWYLYWPYDGHFLTPAPITGAFYGPPTPGNFPVNPYFPGPGFGYGYAPIPGGPAPIPAGPAPIPSGLPPR